MTPIEVLGAVGTLAGVGGIITFGVFAWRGRGEALAAQRTTNAANDAKLEAERRADAADRAKLDAETISTAAAKELELTKTELERVRVELAAERAAKGKLYAKLAAAGVPVGDVAVDDSLDGLYKDKNR